jgi:UPF0755 protein
MVAAMAAAGIILFSINNKNLLGEEDSYILTVNNGDSVSSVALKLENDNIIKSAMFFKIISKISGSNIQKGSYEITSGMSVKKILTNLVKGKIILVKVIIPEGLIIPEIAQIFALNKICSEDEFINAANNGERLKEYGISAETCEGFLFPDTYMLPPAYSGQQCVDMMVEHFFQEIQDFDVDEEALYDKLIMASVIEREYRSVDEAPMIGSVFYNRLQKGMKLQSCATVVYVLKKYYGRTPSRLYNRDIAIDNPYNTYLYKGLPPSPICNPGLTALNGAIKPAETDFLYFVLKDPAEGRHFFSKNYDDHIDAKIKYLK